MTSAWGLRVRDKFYISLGVESPPFKPDGSEFGSLTRYISPHDRPGEVEPASAPSGIGLLYLCQSLKEKSPRSVYNVVRFFFV